MIDFEQTDFFKDLIIEDNDFAQLVLSQIKRTNFEVDITWGMANTPRFLAYSVFVKNTGILIKTMHHRPNLLQAKAFCKRSGLTVAKINH